MKKLLKTFIALNFSFVLCFATGLSFAEQYITQGDFLEQTLGKGFQTKVLWISADLRDSLKKDLQYQAKSPRIRYWELAEKRVWIVDEIGRDEAITMGFVLEKNKIVHLRILEFRESRGYEVRYPRFTSQFFDLDLNKNLQLDRSIDNITGATLSVNAVKKSARLVLFLDKQLKE